MGYTTHHHHHDASISLVNALNEVAIEAYQITQIYDTPPTVAEEHNAYEDYTTIQEIDGNSFDFPLFNSEPITQHDLLQQDFAYSLFSGGIASIFYD